MNQRTRSLARRLRSASLVATVAIALASVACNAWSRQEAPQRPPADPVLAPAEGDDVWSDFPRVDASREVLDVRDAWPERLGFSRGNASRGAVKALPRSPHKPTGRRLSQSSVGAARDLAWDALHAIETSRDALRGRHAVLGGPGSFLITQPTDDGSPIAARDANLASLVLCFVSAREEPRQDPPEVDDAAAFLQTTWFAVFDPSEPPRGVALLMPGMFGTPEGTLAALTKQLQRRGWCVARMVAQPSDFTSLYEPSLSPEQPQVAAEEIARVFDDRVAECAFAAQAALSELERRRPELAALPRVAIGFSAGAMTLPTVVAREPDRYCGAIMVGGGCHYWLLTQRSNYADWIGAVRPKWVREPTDEQRRAIDDAYLSYARLDSFHTAKSMAGVRSLIIDGGLDFAVPTPLSDALWERLGRPERWRETVGHEMLFARLPSKFPRMLDWLETCAGDAESAPRATTNDASSP